MFKSLQRHHLFLRLVGGCFLRGCSGLIIATAYNGFRGVVTVVVMFVFFVSVGGHRVSWMGGLG